MSSCRTRILGSLLVMALPSPCLGCRRPIPEWRPALGLCVHCRGRLRPTARTCRQCGLPLATLRETTSEAGHATLTETPAARVPAPPTAERCGACLLAPPCYDGILTPFLYLPPVDAVVHQLKFGGLRYLGRHAAEALLQRHARRLAAVDVVVPVPLHWTRRLRRGYNQAVEISRPLARRLRRRHVLALWRVRRTPAQVGRSRATRRALPREVFEVRRPRSVAGRRVLLIDDVVTTGATVDAAAAALKDRGAATVTVAALARTPQPWLIHLDPSRSAGKLLETP